MINNQYTATRGKLTPVSKKEPCIHCGESGSCYRLDYVQVCRHGKVADGWHRTGKQNSQGFDELAPDKTSTKESPILTRDWYYDDREGKPLVRVTRLDYASQKKKLFQKRYENGQWKLGLKDIDTQNIPILYYPKIKFAIGLQKVNPDALPIFIVEGESCTDAVWKLGLPATTNIMGSGNWKPGNTKDLEGAERIVICPDMDIPGVKHALHLVKEFPHAKILLPYPDSPLWDDLSKAKGEDVKDWIEEYKLTAEQLIDAAMEVTPELIQRLERQLSKTPSLDTTTAKKTDKPPKADIVGDEISAYFQNKLAFNNEVGVWMEYGKIPGVWKQVSVDILESRVQRELDKMSIHGYGGGLYIGSILHRMKGNLIKEEWTEVSSKEYLPYENGVLHLPTGKVLEHSPDFFFTWSLARNYNPNAKDCPNFHKFLNDVTGSNPDFKAIILCFMYRAILGGNSEQKFLHIIGKGGTGKTTLQNLIVALIGERNVCTTSLQDFNNVRFEPANAYGKRLVLFPDEDKYTGNLDKFKNLTGNGYLKVERKGKDTERSFRADCAVLMASNHPVFVGGQSKALLRRAIQIPFNQSPKKPDLNLERKLLDESDAILNYVLSLDESYVTKILDNTNDCPEIVAANLEILISTCSVAWWMNEYVVYNPEIETRVMGSKNEWHDLNDKVHIAALTTLYGSYCMHCYHSGRSTVNATNFSSRILELCHDVFNLPEVKKIRGKVGYHIKGLALREPDRDENVPRIGE